MNHYPGLPLFDPEESDRRKRIGQAEAADHARAWTESALACLRSLALNQPELTADDLALALDRAGVGEPHHPNALGALWSQAAARGWIGATDRTVRSRRPVEHSRRIGVLESRICR